MMENDHDPEQLPHPPRGRKIAGSGRACRCSERFGQSATVRLVIDYGDGVSKTITNLPWAKGSTVLDVMNAAKSRPHGITFGYTGGGASAFLTHIDDTANEGGGGVKKNWRLWVNTSYADKSFAVYEVQPLDVVFWRFTAQEGK
jgi:Domain of unknown function (DUF4430)